MTERPAAGGRPVRVAILDDYEIVVVGLARILAPYSERVQVVELDAELPVASEVDVVLYDTFAQVQGDVVDLQSLSTVGRPKVVVFSWNVQPDLVQRALDHGAAGYLSKGLPAEQLVELIERVRDGQVVRPASASVPRRPMGEWPGREHGLSARESEILALITQGLSNQEIADRTYLSINSVKTYIRTAYRKIGAVRRAQAVVWGMQHGFQPDRVRHVADGA